MKVLYQCEICRDTHPTAEQALACENQSVPDPPPRGLIVTATYLSRSGDELFCGLATGLMTRWRHFYHPAWYLFRGNGAGDDDQARDDILQSDWLAGGDTDLTAGSAQRAIARAIELGMEPLVVRDGCVVRCPCLDGTVMNA